MYQKIAGANFFEPHCKAPGNVERYQEELHNAS